MTLHCVIDPAGEPIEVSDHAIDRYLERVDGRCTAAEAAQRIAACGRGIRSALRFGARIVKMPSGHRLIIAADRPCVITVCPRGSIVNGDKRAFPSLALQGQ